MTGSFESWILERKISEIECLIPDMNGVLRGKVLPAAKFVRAQQLGALRMPSSVFAVTVTGEYAGDEDRDIQDPDMLILPDIATLRLAPGFQTPTAFVFADAHMPTGEPWQASPRNLLKKVLGLYAKRGWRPVVAPELEFYLTAPNVDPDLPLTPPVGRSGRPETSPQPYGLEALTEYEELIEAIYEQGEAADLHLDTMIHESGTAQLEINFHHGDPLLLADQVLIFKRIVRQVALQHSMHATFMAKPMAEQPGSAMHLHCSLVDEIGANLFADADGNDTPTFRHFVGGLQKLLPEISPLFAPTVNSFRRMRPSHSAPINVQWGVDNRSCGLRVPIDDAQNRRIENRLPGADANPYLATAAMLIAGWIGIEQQAEPQPQVDGSAYHHARTLPRTLEHAMDRLRDCTSAIDILGEQFLTAFSAIKQAELDHFQHVVSSWERDHLLLKV